MIALILEINHALEEIEEDTVAVIARVDVLKTFNMVTTIVMGRYKGIILCEETVEDIKLAEVIIEMIILVTLVEGEGISLVTVEITAPDIRTTEHITLKGTFLILREIKRLQIILGAHLWM